MIEYGLNLIMKNGMEGIVKESKGIEKQVKFYNGKIEIIKEWMSHHIEIFMAKKNKKIVFNVNSPTKEKVKNAIEKNMKILSLLANSEYYGIQVKKGYKNYKKYDKRVIENEEMIKIAEEAISKGGEAGIVYSGIEEERIMNSYGIEENDKNSMIYLSSRSFYRNSSAHDVSCGRSIEGIDTSIASKSYEMAKENMKIINIKEGRYDVIFYPMAFANLISNFASFSSAFYVDAGYSFLQNKINNKVGSDIITIYDDGTIANGIASKKFDDEGNATQRTKIVENGILKSYLHNSTTAYKYKAKTTGNAGIISPHPWNVIVSKGDYNLNEMQERFKGIVITNVWYTRFQNYRNGDFSTVARDSIFYFENGKIWRVKKARVSDNLQRIMENVVALSKERKQIFWWEVETPVFTPYAMVKNVRITKS